VEQAERASTLAGSSASARRSAPAARPAAELAQDAGVMNGAPKSRFSAGSDRARAGGLRLALRVERAREHDARLRKVRLGAQRLSQQALGLGGAPRS
jgi:hypothetical protein